MASFEMFLHYENEKGCIKADARNKMKNEFYQILLALTKEQEQLTQDNDVIRLFVDAFNQLLFSQQMTVCEIGGVGKKICTLKPSSRHNIGYYDGVYYYFLSHLLYGKICAFYNSGSSVFPWTQRELINSLKNTGILLTDNSGANTVKKTIDETQMRVLRLDAAKIENFYSEMEG